LQGRRWGKRRVSWLGMRPKHTAILITSLTGGVIALLSVLTLLLIVPPVRDVLLNGEKAIKENKDRNEKFKQEQILTTKELREDVNRLSVYKSQLEDTRAQLEPLVKQTNELRSQNAVLMARKAELQTRATMLEQQVLHSQNTLRAAQGKIHSLDRLAAQLTLQNQNAATINSDLGKDNIAKTREIEALKQTDTDLQTDIEKLQKTKSDLAEQTRNLQASYDGVDNAYHKLLDANAEASRSLEAEIVALKRERDDVARQRDQLYTEIAGNSHEFAQTYLALRGTKLALRAGGELARTVVSPHERAERVRADLNALLEQAASNASRHGAMRGENGREVAIVTKRVMTASGAQNANEEASLGALTEAMTGRDRPTVVIAYVVYNSLAGEPALIELKPSPVVPVYAAGETVATRRIDVRRATDEIFADILKFLQQEVRDAAIRKGILPQIDPQTGIPQVGVVSYSDLFRVTEQVRRMGGTVRISAIVRHPLTSADALDVELRAERVAKPSTDEVPTEALRPRN
ncbi:MAG: hypothetical protein JWL77_698, partial [Chthonomonadaceae bacterium]|nr:hypothetical protein [Chthonomonadaceae bacterium]